MELTNSQNISVMFYEDQTEETWDEICKLILECLKENGYNPLEVIIY